MTRRGGTAGTVQAVVHASTPRSERRRDGHLHADTRRGRRISWRRARARRRDDAGTVTSDHPRRQPDLHRARRFEVRRALAKVRLLAHAGSTRKRPTSSASARSRGAELEMWSDVRSDDCTARSAAADTPLTAASRRTRSWPPPESNPSAGYASFARIGLNKGLSKRAAALPPAVVTPAPAPTPVRRARRGWPPPGRPPRPRRPQSLRPRRKPARVAGDSGMRKWRTTVSAEHGVRHQAGALQAAMPPASRRRPGLEVFFRADPAVHGGVLEQRLAEDCRSAYQLTWDNAALIAPPRWRASS